MEWSFSLLKDQLIRPSHYETDCLCCWGSASKLKRKNFSTSMIFLFVPSRLCWFQLKLPPQAELILNALARSDQDLLLDDSWESEKQKKKFMWLKTQREDSLEQWTPRLLSQSHERQGLSFLPNNGEQDHWQHHWEGGSMWWVGVVNGRRHLPENGLLNEEHITTCFLYLFAYLKNVLLLLTKDSIHLRIIRNNDLIFHL